MHGIFADVFMDRIWFGKDDAAGLEYRYCVGPVVTCHVPGICHEANLTCPKTDGVTVRMEPLRLVDSPAVKLLTCKWQQHEGITHKCTHRDMRTTITQSHESLQLALHGREHPSGFLPQLCTVQSEFACSNPPVTPNRLKTECTTNHKFSAIPRTLQRRQSPPNEQSHGIRSGLTSEIIVPCLASLPDEVLKVVLQHVPLKDRLNSCCLVNTRHAVAVAATQELRLGGWDNPFTDEKAAGFWPLIADFGQFLTRLDLSHFPQPLQHLPCPNLLELKLYGCDVQLGPAADGTPGVIHGCTKLTKLDLDSNIIDAPEGTVVDSLSCLVHLQHLEAEGMWEILHSYKFGGLSQATLPRLNHLTQLAFKSLSKENLGQLGGLTNLQELFLPALEDGSAAGPSSVPGLVLPASQMDQIVSPSLGWREKQRLA